MSEGAKPPGYMAQLLDALGWSQGTRIPLAHSANQELETQLIDRYSITAMWCVYNIEIKVFNSFYHQSICVHHHFRQAELQRLKEALILQKQKTDDLNNYKNHVLTEYQENTVSVNLNSRNELIIFLSDRYLLRHNGI